MAQGLIIAGIYADFGERWRDCNMAVHCKYIDCNTIK